MSNVLTFVQIQGRAEMFEAELPETATVGDVHDVLDRLDFEVDADTLIYVDDAEEAVASERPEPVHGLKRGCRLHVCRCRRVETTVNFMDQTAERAFPPGARVRAVKEWAVRRFRLDPKDAAEHVLQICCSNDRPSSDTPLIQLVEGRCCTLCFDLVPEKRVEG